MPSANWLLDGEGDLGTTRMRIPRIYALRPANWPRLLQASRNRRAPGCRAVADQGSAVQASHLVSCTTKPPGKRILSVSAAVPSWKS